MTAEIPERKEIECPRDLSSVETGNAGAPGSVETFLAVKVGTARKFTFSKSS
jgi:hypothetical protein